ncbi:hypothetical protein K438DRAFT_1962181 [Mycena galopus ATCC 62051]|nr:hypothetical protein K438DRAFT_1962181 [Mycena galopus ATCC 62051]
MLIMTRTARVATTTTKANVAAAIAAAESKEPQTSLNFSSGAPTASRCPTQHYATLLEAFEYTLSVELPLSPQLQEPHCVPPTETARRLVEAIKKSGYPADYPFPGDGCRRNAYMWKMTKVRQREVKMNAKKDGDGSKSKAGEGQLRMHRALFSRSTD